MHLLCFFFSFFQGIMVLKSQHKFILRPLLAFWAIAELANCEVDRGILLNDNYLLIAINTTPTRLIKST